MGNGRFPTAGRVGAFKDDGEGGVFNMDDGLMDSTDPGWIHRTFDTLIGIFNGLGLQINVRKTVVMVCKPYWAYGVQTDEAYTRWITGGGQSFKERQQ